MTDERKKFDINTIDIDTSSQESKFNVDDQNHSADAIDNFQSIGEDYAGRGPLPGRAGQAANEEAKAGLNLPQTSSNMLESMYGREFGQTGALPAKVPATIQEVPDETDNREGAFSSISNVRNNQAKTQMQGNEQQSRHNLMNQLGKEGSSEMKQAKKQAPGLFPSANKFSLATNDQWGFQADRADSQRSSHNLGNSARLSQDRSAQPSINMQDYDTIKQMDSLEAKRDAYGTSPMPQGMTGGDMKSPMNGSDSHRAGSCSSQRQDDAALAEAIVKSRSRENLNSKEPDDITAKMTLEMQESNDVKPMDRAQATASHNARAKPTTASKPPKSDLKKKVKGNMGLAIHHGTNVADAVQLDANLIQDDDEEDIFADEDYAQMEVKQKADDDFGMSSDEEDALNQRKRAQKRQEAEQRRIQQEMEQQRILEEQKELTRKTMELQAKFNADRKYKEVKTKVSSEQDNADDILADQKALTRKLIDLKAEFAADKLNSKSPSKQPVTQISPDPKPGPDEPIQQVMSFDDGLQNNSNLQVQFVEPDSGLTPVPEMYDETTETNQIKRFAKADDSRGSVLSPNQLNTLRSDSKMLPQSRLVDNDPPINEINKSEIMNVDDIIQKGAAKVLMNNSNSSHEQEEKKKPEPKKPSFLGRLGAMIGLMQQSNFAGQEEEDGRLGSASTIKSIRSKDAAMKSPPSRKSKPAQQPPQENSMEQPPREQFVPQAVNAGVPSAFASQGPRGNAMEPQSPAKPGSRQSANRERRHSSKKSKRPQDHQEEEEKQAQFIKVEQQSEQDHAMNNAIEKELEFQEAERLGEAIVLTPAAANIILRTTNTAEANKDRLEEQKIDEHGTPKTIKDLDMKKGNQLNSGAKSAGGVPQMNERMKRQQARILKAAQEGKDLNDSYYDEVESQNQDQEQIDPYEISHKQGYESSSTAHRVKSSAATKLQKKIAQFQQEEVATTKVQPDLVHSGYVNPEKDETHNLFAEKKNMLQDQGVVLRKGDFNQLHPHSGKQAIVDTLRFAGCFIYLTDLCVKIAYFNNTKWISEEIRHIWLRIFEFRPIFILFYHAWFAIFSFVRSYNEYAKEREKPNYNQVHAEPGEDNPASQREDTGDFKDQIEQEELKEYRRSVARSTLQRLCEITTQALILPLTMYSGFSRLTSLREIKTNYLYLGLGQELILHQLPLGLLFFYNQKELDKPDYALDKAVMIIGIIHCTWLLFEMCMFRSYLNKGVNLEQRIKHSTDVRIKDLIRLGFIACLIGGLFMMPAFMAFSKQECKTHFYEVGDWECHDCFDFHGDECESCIDSARCNRCVAGHYLHNNTCHTCSSYWPGCVDCLFDSDTESEKSNVYPNLNTLDLNPTVPGFRRDLQVVSNDLDGDGYSGGTLGDDVVSKVVMDPVTFKVSTQYFEVSKCLKAAHGFYFDRNNQVVSCKTLENCEQDACGEYGCEKCVDGYYLEDNECKQCEITGCAKCSKADQCIECTSDFLTVQEDGSCKCNIEDGIFPHMSVDRYGSCQCEDGYWLTEFGCQTCDELIPGCEQCYRTSSNTGIPLYEGANVGRYSRQYYIDCRKCPYHDYRQRANVSQGTKPQCVPCSNKWEGCGYCGTYGNRCTKCLETHVYDSRNYYNPCRPCWCWMGRCIWCRGQNDCVKYWDVTLPWPEYDLTCA